MIDLLPDRETETVARWLRAHPGAEIVSRDRVTAYADATRNAAPHAIQVADRWHLLRNLSEALKGTLEPHHRILAQAATTVNEPQLRPPFFASTFEALPQAVSVQHQSRERRHSRYEQVMDLRGKAPR